MIIPRIRPLPHLSHLIHRLPFILTAAKEEPRASLYGEKYLKRLLWYLFAGTRGGPSRAEIIRSLQNRPSNANQLAQILGVDYKTIQHHVRVLEENGLIVPSDKGTYGAVLFLTPKMEEALPILDEIWSRIGRRKINGTKSGGE
jgi:DNA-binding transcriptional ArsR family regulator